MRAEHLTRPAEEPQLDGVPVHARGAVTLTGDLQLVIEHLCSDLDLRPVQRLQHLQQTGHGD